MTLIDNLITLTQFDRERLPAAARRKAEFSLLDWIACGLAGASEPLAEKLRQLAAEEAGRGVASVIGNDMAPARTAALVNGATSHALDYDDTHFAHIGHLSVAVLPAALAAGEETDATANAVIDAFLTGAEIAIRVGCVLGTPHYNLGFHQTATAGAFGATAAAGRIYGLTKTEMRHALGLCATRASGLKSQFGTMGKPYNAGIAASNGVECAKLAKFGMTSADDGLLGQQGFVPTHTPEYDPDAGCSPAPDEKFLFEDNKYKLHACCHGLHAMIEALLDATPLRDRTIGDVASFALRTNPRWLRVCDVKRPRTGLEVKFSYAWLAGMTLRGDQTGDERTYTDKLANDTELDNFAGKVTVTGDDTLTDLQAAGIVTLYDGTTVPVTHDLVAPLPDDVLGEKLRAKAEALLGQRGKALWERFSNLENRNAREIGEFLRGAD